MKKYYETPSLKSWLMEEIDILTDSSDVKDFGNGDFGVSAEGFI